MNGAGDRTRTGTVLLPRDFKSLVSTYSTTPADLQGSFFFSQALPILCRLEKVKICCMSLSLSYIYIISYFFIKIKYDTFILMAAP